MEQFVRVRVVQGNGMDLSLFQFDYDLTFSVFFMNADKTIYGRFGTRTDLEDATKDISIDGFKQALEAALELHKGYPENKSSLVAKTGPEPVKKTPEAFPALLRYSTTLNFNERINQQCIHCHQIGEAQREIHWYDRKPVPDEVLYPFPMPDVLGLRFSPKHRAKLNKVEPGSSAEKDGFRRADEILTLDGQPIISIADVQWVLHRSPENITLPVTIDRHGEEVNLTLTLNPGWRKGSDISWRTTTGELRFVALGGMVLKELSDVERQRSGIGEKEMALKVDNIWRRGRGSDSNAQKAGIRRGDTIIAYGDRTDRLTESGVIAYMLQEEPQAKSIPVKLLRNEEQVTVELSLE